MEVMIINNKYTELLIELKRCMMGKNILEEIVEPDEFELSVIDILNGKIADIQKRLKTIQEAYQSIFYDKHK